MINGFQTKCLIICLILMAACAAHGQITYRTTGTTLTKVVQTIADKIGEKLTVHKDLANEVIVVDLKDVSVGDFQAKIAECVSGKWIEKEGGVKELVIDATTSERHRAAAQQAYATMIPEQIETARKMYAQEGVQSISGDRAATKLAIDIGERLGTKRHELALPWRRVVFSTHPNQLQEQLPDIADLLSGVPSPRPVVKVVFAIERPTSSPFTRYKLSGYDAGNNVVLQAHTSLVSFGKRTAPSLEGKPIKWSPAALELAKYFGSWDYRVSQGLIEVPRSLLDVLSKPTETDPISFTFGEGILACGDEWRTNVIACISDDEETFRAISGMTTGEFWAQLNRRPSVKCERSDGWVVVRPADPVEARRTRGDRVALERLFAKTQGLKMARLSDVAEFALSNPNCRNLQQTFLFPFQASVNYYGQAGEGYVSGDIRHLQLYGALPLSVRSKLENGEALAVGSLPVAAKNLLAAMAYEPDGALLNNSDIEPTEVLPNGLNNAVLSATVSQVSLIAPMPDAGEPKMPVRGMDPRAIAVQRWNRIHDDSPYAKEIPELNRVILGTRKIWKFKLTERGREIGSWTVADDTFPKDHTITTMAEAPDAVQAEIEKAFQDYSKYMGGGG